MSYSNFAMHCPNCNDINEPINKARTHTGNHKATFRCGCNNTWQQTFNVNHEAPTIEPPEEKEEKELPPVPKEEILEWSDEQRNQYIQAYGEKAYKDLVSKHFKDGEAFAENPEDEPDMPTDFDPRNWTAKQRENFISKHGRETYQQRVSDMYNPVKED